MSASVILQATASTLRVGAYAFFLLGFIGPILKNPPSWLQSRIPAAFAMSSALFVLSDVI